MLTKFSDLLKETTLLDSSNALQVNMAVKNAWLEVRTINEELKKHVKVKMVKDHTLFLTSHNPAWAQEAQLQNRVILQKINAKLQTKMAYSLEKVVIFAE